nr:hypothetical protein GCM10023233_09600 [Brevibacterium otitidis]
MTEEFDAAFEQDGGVRCLCHVSSSRLTAECWKPESAAGRVHDAGGGCRWNQNLDRLCPATGEVRQDRRALKPGKYLKTTRRARI